MSRSDYASRYVKKRKRSVVTEVGIFTTGFGLVLIALAVAFFYIMTTNDVLFGMPRGQAISLILALLAIVCIVPGVLLLAMRSKMMIWLCVVCASIPAIAYLALAVAFGMTNRDVIGTAILVAIPIMLVTRGLKANQELDSSASQGENAQ